MKSWERAERAYERRMERCDIDKDPDPDPVVEATTIPDAPLLALPESELPW